MTEKVYPAVPPTPGSEPYWEGAKAASSWSSGARAARSLTTIHAASVRTACQRNLEWREAKGTGEIYTYSIMHAAKPAYVVAYVTLDEGVSMMTNIVDVDPATVKVGQRVKVVFKPSEGGGKLPCFTPL